MEKGVNIIITAAGVLVALFIGGMQVYIAIQQKRISVQQAKTAALQGEMQVVSSWLPFLKDDDPDVRYMTVIALERLHTQSTVAPLATALSDSEENIRNRAATALSKIATEDVIDVIVHLLDNQNSETRNVAINTLVKIGYENLDKITAALSKASPTIQSTGKKVIERILLNEHALNKIGAIDSQRQVAGNPEIVVAILGAGVDQSIVDIQKALISEFNYVADSGKPFVSTTFAARFIVGAPDSEIVGVAPGVRLISERVLSERGAGGYDTVVKGIRDAVQRESKIIYADLGGKRYDAELQKCINDAYASGCIIIAPAGNSNSEEKEFPAAMDNVLAVAATTPDDRKTEYSSYGEWVDISAPGNPITADSASGSGLALLRGTSFSASLVAGAAALIWSADPSLTNKQVEEMLLKSADSIDDINPSYKEKLGKGRLNVLKAINSLR